MKWRGTKVRLLILVLLSVSTHSRVAYAIVGGPHLGGLIFILLIVFATCGVIRCVRKRRRRRLARLQAMAAANGAEVQMAPTGLSQPPATTSPAPRATYAAGVPSSSAPTSFGGYTRVNLQEV